MENSKLEIRPVDMDEIVLQAKKIAGLTQVFEIFIAEEQEDFLPSAFECLTDLAFQHQDDCKNLLNELYKADKNS